MRSSALATLVVLSLLAPRAAEAAVFYARDEALHLAFPEASRIEPEEHFVTATERSAIEAHCGAPLSSDLVTVYRGFAGERLLGYALIDTRRVRTMPETLLIVLTPEGEVRHTELLAFYEPLEYRPPSRWLERFDGTRAQKGHVAVDAISGATFTTHASAAAIRYALAVYHVLLAPKTP